MENSKEKENNGKKRKRNEKETNKEKDLEKMMLEEVEAKTYKYIGETSRSAQERGQEHLRDLKDYEPGSHFLKHIIQHHMNSPETVEFRMKILSSYFTPFSRQIAEAVKINRNKGPYLLNSKSEYNRCGLPSIRLNDKKTPWELSDISESEMKDPIRILKHNKTKFKNFLVVENENDEKTLTPPLVAGGKVSWKKRSQVL